jgi:hypothetical protein
MTSASEVAPPKNMIWINMANRISVHDAIGIGD